MSLRTHPLALTTSDQTVLTVPEGQEATCNNILCTGSGSLTLKFKEAATGATHTVFAGKSVTDQIALERSFNLASGDQLIASDDGSGLSLFASVYYVGADAGSAALPYGPGPQEPIAGDHNNGYFGVVPAEAFYSGNRLALELGVTEGTLQNSDAGWLKFAHNGVIKFIAKKTFMWGASWVHLYSRGVVYGTDDNGKAPIGTPTNQFTTVEHGGNRFVVRLMTGANADPFYDSDPLYGTDDMCQMNIGEGSEWNDLMYRVHQDVPDCPDTIGMGKDNHGGAQDTSNWVSLSGGQINVGDTLGKGSLCQETIGTSVIRRGFSDIASVHPVGVRSKSGNAGWRPVLELIPQSENL